ncbi:16S rRNA (cytidine(1402)-2'-O)-methyltransferase [Spiroplasma turonicum]|uniref:Methyltransferase n=1 Tax=Spiroplasma turonicum TaxID=216946 RepID=A0A0K1P770_9MOLU|nr:16S rRNA (cytidine(1402)-2'-O)-methyltransferase [Spiroplasma turonicum]AKU80135.1 methyltransferase [Spiroplasma turonicum]ALX71135.1 16S rRNA (cytidine1402-2'-O)-methyltransferase [Spiroplasma turonicum]
MLKIQNTFKNNNKTIYLVGTPIGNLDDISLRAIEVLKNSDLIYCEDKRVSINLLNKYSIKTRLKTLHKFNEQEEFDYFKTEINDYNKISIISDAGVPCISDPGMYFVNSILNFYDDINITAVNAGPAYIHTLLVSGFISYKNIFLGFLKKNTNDEIIEQINNNSTIVCFYESVHRIITRINSLSLLLPLETNIVIGREISKINEQFIHGTLEEVKAYLNSNDFIAKGEFSIVLDLSNIKILDNISENKIEELVLSLKTNGLTNKDIIKELHQKYKINKNTLSNIIYKLKK